MIDKIRTTLYLSEDTRKRLAALGGVGPGNMSQGADEALRQLETYSRTNYPLIDAVIGENVQLLARVVELNDQLDAARAEISRLEQLARLAPIEAINPDAGQGE